MNAPTVYQLIFAATNDYAAHAAILNRLPNPIFYPRISQKKRRIQNRRRQSFPVR